MSFTPDGPEAEATSVVGRQAEARYLDAALVEARTRPRVVFVEGSPGSGKTTLVSRFLARHPDRPHVLVPALSWEASTPGALLRRIAEASDWPWDGDPTSDPVTRGRWLAARWTEARPPAPILVVDDAHVADTESVQALVTALTSVRDVGLFVVLVVGTGPDTLPRHGTRDALGRLAAPRLRLAPLTPEQTRLFAARVAGIDLPMPIARRLCRHTEGVPRHLEEILRDSPPVHWSDWQTRLPAPTSVQTAVQAGLDGCSRPARLLVEAAAVLGDTPRLADAARLAQVQNPIEALDEAFAANLLAPAAGHGLDVLTFPRRFVRGAVHAALTPSRRHALHLGAAELAADETDRLRHLVEAAPLPDVTLADDLVALARRKADEGAWAVVAGALIDAARISPDRTDREDRLIQAIDALAGAGLVGRATDAQPDVEGLPRGPRRDAVLAYVAIQRGRRA